MSPNNYVFNSKDSPLYVISTTSITDPLVTTPIEYDASAKGLMYTVTTRAQSVVANGFLMLQLTNPPTSGKNCYVMRLSGGAITNTIFCMFKNATFSSEETVAQPINLNFSSTNTSITTCKYITQGTNPTTGGVQLNSIIQGGEHIDIVYNGDIIVTPNTTLLLCLTNATNQANTLSVNLSWWELPV